MVAEPGSYRPLAPDDALPVATRNGAAAVAERPIHLASPFPEPDSDAVIDFGVEPAARLRARARAARPMSTKRSSSTSPSCGKDKQQGRARQLHRRRARAACGPARGPWPQVAEAGRQLAGSARRARPTPALIVLPLDHGFTAPDVAVLTEQDMLGDRLVRGARSAARAPTPSSPSWRRSRPATSSSTPTMASAATRG